MHVTEGEDIYGVLGPGDVSSALVPRDLVPKWRSENF